MKEGKEEKKPFGISIDMDRTKPELEHSIGMPYIITNNKIIWHDRSLLTSKGLPRIPLNMTASFESFKKALLKLKKL